MKLSYRNISKLALAAVCAATLGLTVTSCDDDDEKIEEVFVPESPTRPSVEVGADDVWIKVGESQTIAVTAGSGDYHAISLNPERVKVEMSGDNIVATALNIGEAEILVTDALNNVANVKVISYETKEITFTDASFSATILLGYSDEFTTQVTNGNGGYEIASDNPRVEARIGYDTGIITISARSANEEYTANVTVTDCVGIQATLPVTVKASLDPTPASFIAELEAKSSDYIYFDVAGISEHEPYWYFNFSANPDYSLWYDNETGISRVNYESEGGQVYITPDQYVFGWWMAGENDGFADYGGLFMSAASAFTASDQSADLLFKYSNNTWWPFRQATGGQGRILVNNADKVIAVWWRHNVPEQHMDRAVWVHIK